MENINLSVIIDKGFIILNSILVILLGYTYWKERQRGASNDTNANEYKSSWVINFALFISIIALIISIYNLLRALNLV